MANLPGRFQFENVKLFKFRKQETKNKINNKR